MFLTAAIGAVGGALIGGIKAAVKGESVKEVAKSALKGAAVGGLIGLGAGAVAGAPFKKGQPCGSVQIGVDPNTLTPTKDLSTLDPRRIHNAVKYAGDRALEVTQNGEVLQGHHRLANAIRIGKAVDVEIK